MIRKFSKLVLTLAAIVSVCSIVSLAQSQTLMTRHTRDEVTTRVAPLVGRMNATQNMELTLVLQHRNQGELEQLLQNLYDRSHPSYRHFLTVEQFTEKFGPSREDYESVKSWARENGLTILSSARNRQIVRVSGSVKTIEKALNVTMGLYQHPAEDRSFYAPDREPLPNMGVRLWSIAGLDNFSTPKALHERREPSNVQGDDVISDATTGSCPSKSFCGSDMRAAYYGGTLDGTGQTLGIFNFIGTDLNDLTTYFTNAGQTNFVPVTLLSVDGQQTTCTLSAGCDDTEPTLDMTQSISMAPHMSSLVMYIGKGGLSGQSLDDPGILNAMATASPLNAQLSCSWAWKPADSSTDDPFFQEFAAQGQNFFTASGDSGKWKSSIFVWPADDPFVTAVGGTDLKTVSAGGAWSSETAWIDSGGGTSTNNFAIPSWQVSAATGCTNCSKTLRNGPDISANADFTFYVCSDQGSCTANNFGGTSFAAPMWAGFMALINQQALANGNPPLGFINPALYSIYGSSSYTTDFHDILTGTQTGGTNSATVGFDPVTGIGSPNGQALIDALAGTSTASFSLSASPTSVSVAQGASGTSTITSTTTGGFSSPVTLSASGQPSGVTVSFSPASITGTGTSTMTMTVGSSTVAGTYTITVTGTSGSTTSTTTVSLTVTSTTTGSFTLNANPKTLTIPRNSIGRANVQTTATGGFNSSIALTASGQGSGVTVSFTPSTIPAPGTGHSSVQIRVTAGAATGTRTITVTGTGGGVTKTTTITITIT